MSLDDAPAHILLAVDLIQVLEANSIPPEVAIPALEIVLTDYHNKLNRLQATAPGQLADATGLGTVKNHPADP